MLHPPSQRFSDYLDGELDARAAAEVETHLRECPGCRALLRDLEEIQARARALPELMPDRDLWPDIAAGILAGDSRDLQVIALHPPPSPLPRSERRSRRGFRVSYPQAVAAGLALALFSGSLGALFAGGRGPAEETAVEGRSPLVELVSQASPGLGEAAQEVARLEGLLARHRSRLDPETARILEKNLMVIDQAIRESLSALESDPGNAFLENHLARSVQAKAEYLREAAAFVVPEG
jgi:hypothetical protein